MNASDKRAAAKLATESAETNTVGHKEGEWILIHEERRIIPDQTFNLMLILMGLMFAAASILMIIFYGPIGPEN